MLRAAKRLRPETVVVMITAHGSEKIAVEAMKAGAEDYVPKPFDNEEIRLVVQRALERTRLARDHRELLDRVQRQYAFESLIGTGAAMQRVFETIRKVAETDLTVLVRGESGTGKELVAQALHNRSQRRNRPFVAVNCAAIAASWSRANCSATRRAPSPAPTRAVRAASRWPTAARSSSTRSATCRPRRRPSCCACSRSARSSASAAPSRSRWTCAWSRRRTAISRRRCVRAASARTSTTACAWSRSLLPPLRERLADVPALALRFLEQVNERLGREKQRLSESALAHLAHQRWPGNVRELRNAIEQASVLASSALIDVADFQLGGALAPSLQELAPPADAEAPQADAEAAHFSEAKRRAVEGFERDFLLRALRANRGNISRAAESIGMVRQSLQQKIRELDLRSEDWSDGDE